MSSRISSILFAVLLAAAGSFQNVSATEFYANAVSGDDGNDGLTPAAATRTITAALALANDAGAGPHTVHVAPGTYDTDLGEEFPLEPADGVSLVGVPADPAQVVIAIREGGEDPEAVRFERQDEGNVPLTTVVEGFTFFSDKGDGEHNMISLVASDGDAAISPTIRNNIFALRPDADGSEAAIGMQAFSDASVSPRISNNRIIIPVASEGIRGSAEGSFATVSPTIDGNFITAGVPVQLGSESGGTVEPVITRNTITGTSSGVSLIAQSAEYPIAGTVSNNVIAASPGIHVGNKGITTIFENNTLRGTGGGAAVEVDGSTVVPPDLGGGAGGSLGHNTIHGDVANGADDLIHRGITPMFAENNWWTDFPPTHIDAGPGVDADPANDPTLAFTIDSSKTIASEVTLIAGANSFFVDRVGATETRLEILFGGTPGGNIRVNAAGAEVTVQPPPGNGTVDVTVTNPAGQTGVLLDGFTLTPAVCADARFPQCDLPCPDPNDICTPSPTGGQCRCESPLLVKLESFTATIGQDGVRVAWETSAEVDNAGFRVLRMRRRENFNRKVGKRTALQLEVTSPLIVARGSDLSGARYEYLDHPGGKPDTLVYYLEDLDLSGQVTLHGPLAVDRKRSRSSMEESPMGHDISPTRLGWFE